MNINKAAKMVATITGWLIVVAGISMLIYTMWNLTRMWNYSLSYESMVQETICEMVKPEHLKEPCDE